MDKWKLLNEIEDESKSFSELSESKEDIEKFKAWGGELLYNKFLKQKSRLEPKERLLLLDVNDAR